MIINDEKGWKNAHAIVESFRVEKDSNKMYHSFTILENLTWQTIWNGIRWKCQKWRLFLKFKVEASIIPKNKQKPF